MHYCACIENKNMFSSPVLMCLLLGRKWTFEPSSITPLWVSPEENTITVTDTLAGVEYTANLFFSLPASLLLCFLADNDNDVHCCHSFHFTKSVLLNDCSFVSVLIAGDGFLLQLSSQNSERSQTRGRAEGQTQGKQHEDNGS